MMRYQLWDLVGGGLLGRYETEAEALEWVNCYREEEGPEYAADLVVIAGESKHGQP